jgi:hypothetical protein
MEIVVVLILRLIFGLGGPIRKLSQAIFINPAVKLEGAS